MNKGLYTRYDNILILYNFLIEIVSFFINKQKTKQNKTEIHSWQIPIWDVLCTTLHYKKTNYIYFTTIDKCVEKKQIVWYISFAWILARRVIDIWISQSARENPLVQAVDHHNLSNTTTIDYWDRSDEELLLYQLRCLDTHLDITNWHLFKFNPGVFNLV